MKLRRQIMLGGMVMIASLFSSCEKIDDDPQGCGLYVDFKYDYNMLYTDAFHAFVNKVDLYVFDRDSNFLFKQVAEGSQLADKNFRMHLNMPAGESKDLIVMAWAGSVKNFTIEPQGENPASIKELKLRMEEAVDGVNNTDLGNLWYGEMKDIKYLAQGEQIETINLIKDTNRFKIVLQNVGEANPVSVDDLSIRLLVNNSYYNHLNQIIPTHTIAYQPYSAKDVEGVGAVAELNTMRLTTDTPVVLVIKDNKRNMELLNIDLMKYLLATQMEGHKMEPQEYLDRQSEFTIILFYTNSAQGAFLSAKIVVNNWTLWMYESDL